MEVGTITRRTEFALNGLQNDFKSLYVKEEFDQKINALKETKANSGRSSKLRSLFDMFDACEIEYERGKDDNYYEDLVNRSNIPSIYCTDDKDNIEDRMLLALYSRYKQFPSPEDYMTRIVDRLCNSEDGWNNDTLRVRILKQFIKYGNYLYDAGGGGRGAIRKYIGNKIGKTPTDADVLSILDDDVFSCLETATRAQKKFNGTYGLLKVADDLATGKFRVEGATKKNLYLFAMVYGMTYNTNDEDDDTSNITDIERLIFRDYYTNNLMRFISEAYKGKLCEYELDPSGQGINFKNYAEMIYIYFISKDDYSRLDKIKRSSEMIKRVSDKNYKQGHVDTEEAGGTVFYRDLFSEDILQKNPEEFEEFVCSNYDCDTYDESYDNKIGELQLQVEQRTASHEYNEILKEITELGVDLKNCNYGLWFTDVAAFRQKGYKNICDRHPDDIDREKYEEFFELLLAINSFLGRTISEEESTTAVTRTSMIVAYYYYFNALHEDEKDEWKSFEELFNSFRRGIDDRLRAAYYQPISGKNIFDVLVAFSSYALLNIG